MPAGGGAAGADPRPAGGHRRRPAAAAADAVLRVGRRRQRGRGDRRPTRSCSRPSRARSRTCWRPPWAWTSAVLPGRPLPLAQRRPDRVQQRALLRLAGCSRSRGHPSRRPGSAPLTLYRADGVYEKRPQRGGGGPRSAEIVRELLNRAEPPSIGIACFNLPQRDLIVEKLDELAGRRPGVRRPARRGRSRARGRARSRGCSSRTWRTCRGTSATTSSSARRTARTQRASSTAGSAPSAAPAAAGGSTCWSPGPASEVHLVTSIPADVVPHAPARPAGPDARRRMAAVRLPEVRRGDRPPLAASRRLLPERSARARDDVRPSDSRRRHSPQALAQFHVGLARYRQRRSLGQRRLLHRPRAAPSHTPRRMIDAWRLLRRAPGSRRRRPRGVGRLPHVHATEQGWELRRVWTPHFFRDPQGAMTQLARAVHAESQG